MKVYRSSVTGKWVTKAYADRNADTTEAEKKVEEVDRDDLNETHGEHEARLYHICEAMRSADPEDLAEWVLEGLEVLSDLRAELTGNKVLGIV